MQRSSKTPAVAALTALFLVCLLTVGCDPAGGPNAATADPAPANDPIQAANAVSVSTSSTAAQAAPITGRDVFSDGAAPVETMGQSRATVQDSSPTRSSLRAATIEGAAGGQSGAGGRASLAPAIALPTTEIVELIAPSVVSVKTDLAARGSAFTQVRPPGEGTGVILTDDGHILTNYHVVQGSRNVTVTLSDGTEADATIVGADYQTDMAVIEIDGVDGLSPAPIGDSATLLVGEDVVAIGYAMGLSGGPTVSKGIVSALGRSVRSDRNATMIGLIQTDASINPGNSGGPLVDSGGEVIGINTAISRGGQGIGFAININDGMEVARQLIDNGAVRRGYIGIAPYAVTPEVTALLGIDPNIEGILVARVAPNTPAEGAGLRANDIILRMNGQKARNVGELSKFLISHGPGDTVDMAVLRDGRELTVSVILGERPSN